MATMRRFWATALEPGRADSQVALVMTVLAVASVLGGLLAFGYGFSAREAPACHRGCQWAGGLVAAMCSAGAVSVGGLLGLLFGAPAMTGGSTSAATDGQGGARGTGGTAQPVAEIRPNTSLERVAGWLTTMMVGIGLANLSEIQERATSMGIWITREITGRADTSNGTVGVVLVLGFGISGFLTVYLWSLCFLPSALRSSYPSLSKRIDDTDRRIEDTNRKVEDASTKATLLMKTMLSSHIYRVPSVTLEQHLDAMKRSQVDLDTIQCVRRLYTKATTTTDEPLEGFGPAQSDGYQLAATVKETSEFPFHQFSATLTPPRGASPGKCFWLLHNAYGPGAVLEAEVGVDGSVIEETASRAFWLGVVVPSRHGAIRLALDLAKADGATDAFRNGPFAALDDQAGAPA